MAFVLAPDLLPWSRHTATLSRRPHRRRGRLSAARSVCLVDTLDEALGRGYVQQIGSQICLDRNGFFPRIESPVLPPEYVNILGDVAAKIVEALGRRNVRAIFIRGSIVTGNLLGNSLSDLDLVVFTGRFVGSDKKRCVGELLLSNVRKTLEVGSVDIRYLHKECHNRARHQFRLSPTLCIILRHFAVPVYGSREDVGITDVPLQATPHLSVDIRNDEVSFRRVMWDGAAEECFPLQLSAIQWLCKRCLRAVAELAALKMRAYARDLLPCYKLGCAAFPSFADTILHGLLIACASPKNRYLDMTRSDIVRTGTSVALRFAEIVEELSLRESFGTASAPLTESPAVFSSDLVVPNWGVKAFPKGLEETLLASLCFFKRRISLHNVAFRTRSLPQLALEGSACVEENLAGANVERFGGTASLGNVFVDVPQPVVFRAHQHEQPDCRDITRNVLESLLRSVPTVQCRIARGHNVTFCRPSHKWIEQQIFTPPSVLISLPVSEAVQRLSEPRRLSNLIYDDCDEECVYIQSRAIPSLRLFEHSGLQPWKVAQEERLWISSHGTVSTLHYDASHSALYQRCGQKRLLFFPPCCLPQLGIYPLGHPLHRRGRVDLTRKDTVIFREFWNKCSSKAIEVILRPGDLLLFPPFWSHYTESMTRSTHELSISHTFRYVCQ